MAIKQIVFKILEQKFQAAYSLDDNRQILFSGPFGSGKTTFLKSFFENQSDVNVFKVYPVNYALHSNTDVYEILKYDIILELIHKKAFEVVDVDRLNTYLFSLAQTADQAVANLLSMFSDTGKNLIEASEILERSILKVKRTRKDINDPLLSVKSFNDVVNKVTAYHYQDYITSVIRQKLEALKIKEKKSNILIVDDLDRIDPEHLFRIISIFSAHIDQDEAGNKFGFDKIIFVGDNQNFRSIFSHKYGLANSYDGYISKLSSKAPFNFDPDREIYSKIGELIQGIQFYQNDPDHAQPVHSGLDPQSKRFIFYVLSTLIRSGALTIRELRKNQGKHKEALNSHEFLDYKIYPLYLICKQIFPHSEQVQLALQTAAKDPLSSEKIMQTGGIDRSKLNAELSSFPLQVILADQLITDLKVGKTETKTIDDSPYVVDYHVARMGNVVMAQLIPENANEEAVLKLTASAFKKLDKANST